ncbi:hypothetical protein CEXT_594571 [Caerostris extrusa]|uniref:Uncharacterized protein n=1 Tax=Caerostris extrusa TaxID=172846 RepID=A0AAV4Y7D2_CAEEX|nr:hypothetical protein CEXT_594571 [Caerostris extrusa]
MIERWGRDSTPGCVHKHTHTISERANLKRVSGLLPNDRDRWRKLSEGDGGVAADGAASIPVVQVERNRLLKGSTEGISFDKIVEQKENV